MEDTTTNNNKGISNLRDEEFSWLERWLEVRKRLGSKSQRVLTTRCGGPLKNMAGYMQAVWAHMGLPGRPSFTDLRTAVSGHVSAVLQPPSLRCCIGPLD